MFNIILFVNSAIVVLSINCHTKHRLLIFERLFEIRFVIFGIQFVIVGKSSPI